MLDLIRQFIHEVEEEDERGRKTGQRFLIFPRYQQLDAVRELVAHAWGHGTGERYLVQHSAGSGKSFTIAWLAHQLSTLHDAILAEIQRRGRLPNLSTFGIPFRNRTKSRLFSSFSL